MRMKEVLVNLDKTIGHYRIYNKHCQRKSPWSRTQTGSHTVLRNVLKYKKFQSLSWARELQTTWAYSNARTHERSSEKLAGSSSNATRFRNNVSTCVKACHTGKFSSSALRLGWDRKVRASSKAQVDLSPFVHMPIKCNTIPKPNI